MSAQIAPLLDTLLLTCTQNSDRAANQSVEKVPWTGSRSGDGGSKLSVPAVPAATSLTVPDLTDKNKCTAHKRKDKSILQKKAYAKYKTVESVLELIDLHSPFEKRYWDTWHCCKSLKQEGPYITGHYCSNRWCIICNRIVTAKLIQAYKPVIATFQDPMFVTLTIVNVTEPDLRPAIQKMIKIFNTINHKFRQNRPYSIFGIRKLEVEPSVHPGEYHPHFHIILESRCVARALIQEWLLSYPTADIRGQNITPCTVGSLAEFFKYTTKPVVKVKGDRSPENQQRTAYQLDVIYRALDKKRIFQPVGVNKSPAKEIIEGITSQKIYDIDFLQMPGVTFWNWNQDAKDWISPAGERLSRFHMNKEKPGFVPTVGYHRRN